MALPEIREHIKEQIEEKGWWGWIRANLIAGLLVTAPIILTYLLISTVILWVDGLLIGILPQSWQFRLGSIPGFGLLGGAILLFLVGMLTRNYLGKQLLKWADDLMEGVPVVRSVYGATKKVVEALSGRGGAAFREVVLVRYPHQESWAMAFLTGVTEGEVQDKTKNKVLNVFVPTTPNPTSGFFLFVPEKDIIRLDMSVDEGIKMVVSGGIVTPTGKKRKK